MKIKVKDPIIKRVVKKFVGRSNVGFKKYGKTLMDDPTDMDGWFNHLQEELMDAVNYIERAREELKKLKHLQEAAKFVETKRQGEIEPSILGYGYFDPDGDMTIRPGFIACNCTMGCSTGRCCQGPPIDNGFNGNG